MSDQAIELRHILAPSLVSVAAAFQLGRFSWAVGQARRKFKVAPPATDGDEGFVRVYRAHQNVLEFVPLFFPCVWVSSLFFHPLPSAIISFGYLYARKQYFDGYSKKTEDRVPHFKSAVKCIQLLFLMSVTGMVNLSLKEYAGINIFGKVGDFVSQYLPTN